jgi:hypothetical protein
MARRRRWRDAGDGATPAMARRRRVVGRSAAAPQRSLVHGSWHHHTHRGVLLVASGATDNEREPVARRAHAAAPSSARAPAARRGSIEVCD